MEYNGSNKLFSNDMCMYGIQKGFGFLYFDVVLMFFVFNFGEIMVIKV